jgi:Transcriptional regulators
MGDSLCEDVYEQFIRIEWLLRRRHLQDQKRQGPAADPHRGQGRVLAILKLKNKVSQKELSSILDMRSQSLGELLAKLERKGYITRTPSENDRRVMEIQLTDIGMHEAEQDEPGKGKPDFFECLDADEQEILKGYFNRIISKLEQKPEVGGSMHRPRRVARFVEGFPAEAGHMTELSQMHNSEGEKHEKVKEPQKTDKPQNKKD